MNRGSGTGARWRSPTGTAPLASLEEGVRHGMKGRENFWLRGAEGRGMAGIPLGKEVLGGHNENGLLFCGGPTQPHQPSKMEEWIGWSLSAGGSNGATSEFSGVTRSWCMTLGRSLTCPSTKH